MKTELKYGLLIGGAICLWVMVEFMLGFHTTRMEVGRIAGYFSMLIPIFGLFFGIKEKQVKERAGTMTFWQCVHTGLGITIISAAVVVAFLYLYNVVINPNWIEHGQATHRFMLEQGGLEAHRIDERMAAIAHVFTLPMQLAMTFVGMMINGIIISMVVAAFVKSKRQV